MGVFEAGHLSGNPILRDHGNGENGEKRPAFVFAQVRQHGLVIRVQITGIFQEALPGLSQYDFAFAAVKKRKTEFLFQRHDLFGYGGLSNVEFVSGGGKTAGCGYRKKVLCLLDFHPISPMYSILEFIISKLELLGYL
jgi:hypothetical protein